MSKKKEKKIINKELEDEQIQLEKEFHKTLFGKSIKLIFSLSITFFVVGLICTVLFKIFNLKQSVLELGENFMEYSGISLFVCMLIYCIFVPEWMGKNKSEKKD